MFCYGWGCSRAWYPGGLSGNRIELGSLWWIIWETSRWVPQSSYGFAGCRFRRSLHCNIPWWGRSYARSKSAFLCSSRDSHVREFASESLFRPRSFLYFPARSGWFSPPARVTAHPFCKPSPPVRSSLFRSLLIRLPKMESPPELSLLFFSSSSSNPNNNIKHSLIFNFVTMLALNKINIIKIVEKKASLVESFEILLLVPPGLYFIIEEVEPAEFGVRFLCHIYFRQHHRLAILLRPFLNLNFLAYCCELLPPSAVYLQAHLLHQLAWIWSTLVMKSLPPALHLLVIGPAHFGALLTKIHAHPRKINRNWIFGAGSYLILDDYRNFLLDLIQLVLPNPQ